MKLDSRNDSIFAVHERDGVGKVDHGLDCTNDRYPAPAGQRDRAYAHAHAFEVIRGIAWIGRCYLVRKVVTVHRRGVVALLGQAPAGQSICQATSIGMQFPVFVCRHCFIRIPALSSI